MPSYTVIAFDCDGVMFDTENANRAYYNDILAYFARPPMTAEQFAYAQMQTVDESIRMLFPEPGEYEKAQAYRRNNGYGPYIGYMEMEPDLIGLLECLRPGIRTAVATNRTDTMNSVLEIHGIESYFDRVVTALDVKHPKPAPDVLTSLLSYFGVDSSDMLYIGDSSVDSLAARAAGVPFAAYGNPALDADYHIERLRAVKAILEKGDLR